MKPIRNINFVPLLALLALAPGCPFDSNPRVSADAGVSATPTASPSPAVMSGGPRAVRIIFKQSYPQGSFDASPSNGTPAVPNSGQKAVRFFNADGSLLAGGVSGSWLEGFEIGISGANNNSAKNKDCAKFADASESGAVSNCRFNSSGIPQPVGCGAPNGLFRVSEYDCMATQGQVPDDGTGGPSDGIYLRAFLNRDQLGTAENIMASIEFIASAFNPAPTNPKFCFDAFGNPSPESCSNVAWKAFLKHTEQEVVQPFFMISPPTQSFVNTGLGTSGVSPQMRQFILPISGDPKVRVLQISRIKSNLDPASSQTTCHNQGGAIPANSPLCAGIVIYSLTLYRI